MHKDSLPSAIAENIVVAPSGCWDWTGYRDSHGYGAYTYHKIVAHRVVYELLVGPIPVGLHLDHLCRVRSCVNPAHLEPVTCRENLLRGEGFAATNARKTHCLRGHSLETAKLRGRTRICRPCAYIHKVAYRARLAKAS